MGIDYEKFAKRWDCAATRGAQMAIMADLARTVADEAAKAASAASPPELDEPPKRADGVPEWFAHIVRWHSPLTSDYQTKAVWKKVEAEIDRRVAGREQRIAELECEKDHAVKVFERTKNERDAALAEVERLKKELEPWDIDDDLKQIEPLLAEALVGKATTILGKAHLERWHKNLADAKNRIAELEARVAEQSKEIERLSRPVDFKAEGVPLSKEELRKDLRRERNAREAEKQRADKAEASLAELAKFVANWNCDHGMAHDPAACRRCKAEAILKHKEPAK